MKKKDVLFCAAVMLFLAAVNLSAIDTKDTRLLHQPAVHGSRIAFVYAGDIWTSMKDGSRVHRLTSHKGNEINPVFSPKGDMIAFSGEYEGNTDVYVVPAEGGVPKRLTFHPGSDVVLGFCPDGKRVLFRSTRNSYTNRYSQLYTVDFDGGFPKKLKIPHAYKAAYSPDGKYIAYVPLYEAFHQWKHYRGGTHSEIVLFSMDDYSVKKIPQNGQRCNDTDPVWVGDMIYFRSDRDGEFNIFSYNVSTGDVVKLTDYNKFPVLDLDGCENGLVFEMGGYLYALDPEVKKHTRLKIGVAADLQTVMPRYAEGFRWIRNGHISPEGKRAVLEYRGEIITLPAEKGDPRNLTQSPGAHDRNPAWSPNGAMIAWFSDESGEYKLNIMNRKEENRVTSHDIKGTGFYSMLNWSPDSKKLSFTDNGRRLYWFDLEKSKMFEIARDPVYMPGVFGDIRGSWSPDSRFIAYTLNTEAYFKQLYIYSLEKNKSFALTKGMSEVSNPVFDKSGEYLYFFGSTDAGPVKHWFAMSSTDMEQNNSIYLMALNRDAPNPLARESDEVPLDDKEQSRKEEKNKDADAEKDQVRIDLEGVENRIMDLPVKAGDLRMLTAGPEGEIYYVRQDGRTGSLCHFSVKEREEKEALKNISGFQLSADRKKIFYMTPNSLHITAAGSKIKPGDGKLKTEAVSVKIYPQQEWKQIFNEAWRINRDYFYDPGFHGADWKAMKEKYSRFLPHLSCRNDLNRVIMWMCSNLVAGHHRTGGGDMLFSRDRIPGGLLGADYEVRDNRYCFKKVYGGLNWNPHLRSPLKQPGIDVKEGEYLLAVNGVQLFADDNLYRHFEKSAGRIVSITVGPNAGGTDSRTIDVEPVSNEYSLRNRDWVESNIRKVHKATDGRVAYVYVPNTAGLGHTYFKRYFFPQADKDAIIIDERFNGGGMVADYYLDILRRPQICHWNLRYGKDLRTPSAAIHGPKVMLIDETAGSGGDLLPWMFRKLKMGTLVGKRTWGGLVGVLGFPTLMDGGYVTAPNLAIWTEDGFVVENVGVPPDVEVEQTPEKVIKGHDPQLEKAIDIILKQLEENPPKEYKRPPYPKRVKN